VIGIVVGPIINTRKRGAGVESSWSAEHRHGCHESPITPSPNPDALHVNVFQTTKIFHSTQHVFQIRTAHVQIDSAAPIASVIRAAAIIHFKHYVSMLGQEVIKDKTQLL